jgi:hypothetical protein
LESISHTYQAHVTNLDATLGIIAQVGVVYNVLERSDQKELLRQMIERVVVNSDGKAALELRAPFTYLKDISDQMRRVGTVSGVKIVEKQKPAKFPLLVFAGLTVRIGSCCTEGEGLEPSTLGSKGPCSAIKLPLKA